MNGFDLEKYFNYPSFSSEEFFLSSRSNLKKVDDNGSQISSSKLKYSWDSFVFTEKAGHNSMKLTCEVQFCVKEKCQPNICV